MIRILKELKQEYPDKELDQLMELANYYALLHQQKSRAFYRVQATRMMIGAGNVLKRHVADHARRAAVPDEEAPPEEDPTVCSRISFQSAHSQCMENCGVLTLGVACVGGAGENTFYVDYRTEDGSANAGSDYEYCEGTLVFKPGETRKDIKVRSHTHTPQAASQGKHTHPPGNELNPRDVFSQLMSAAPLRETSNHLHHTEIA